MEGWSELPPLGPPERRGPRPADAAAALGALLDAVRRDGAFDTLVLADPTGLLVAGAGAHADCEELAALAPLAERPAANDTVPTRLDVVARKMEVRRLTVDGVEVLLCGRGGSGELARAAAGCARILGRRRR